MFANHHIAKGFAAALMLTPIAPALAQPMWSSAAPIEYLQYGSTPYLNLVTESSYSGLFNYAPGAVVHASAMVEAASLPHTEYVPYIGYDLTPFYNLAPGCPLRYLSDDPTHIC